MSENDSDQGFDLSGLLQQAQAMQAKLVEAQEQVRSQTVEGQAGGGAVRITATGGLEFTDVKIDPSAVDPDDVELLQDMVLAALRDTVEKANELNSQAMGGIVPGGLPGGLGGMPGLGG